MLAYKKLYVNEVHREHIVEAISENMPTNEM